MKLKDMHEFPSILTSYKSDRIGVLSFFTTASDNIIWSTPGPGFQLFTCLITIHNKQNSDRGLKNRTYNIEHREQGIIYES